uniref:18S rRNA (guanine-N(7))-methyltransferase n=1 Tax=Gongylonema pulchrum TaxID=637853 RepID=A0A183DU31_9BILA
LHVREMSRPEDTGPPELYYNETQAAKYSQNSHIIDIQTRMSERAVELLALPDDQPSLLLDIGCGSGLSGETISSLGHYWFGVDISEAMIRVAKEDREVDGDIVLKDMGEGLPFRPGTFDGAISISAIQWLCHANTNKQNPQKRLLRFFQSLYACLGRGARAVFQFYPENVGQTELITAQATKAGFSGGLGRGARAVFQFYPENVGQTELITAQATRAGFSGGLVIDYPNSAKAKKYHFFFLIF